MDIAFDRLRELTEAHGVPGYEDRVRDIVRERLAEATDEVRTDGMGNVVGTVHGGGDTDFSVAVAAHMDEIGFMVRHVTDDGFLKVDALGGWDARILRSQRVTVHADDGDLTGVIGSVPPHLLDGDEGNDEEVADVVIDMGRDGDAVAELVGVGDLVTLQQDTVELGDCVSGKSLDDRVCVFTMLEAAERVVDPEVTVHFCATVQEEVGLRGARALGTDTDADLAIALDVTVANDIPQVGDPADHVTELGDGAAIKLKDSSVITTHKVHRRLREVAETEDIDHQLEVLPAGGTDTAGFQTEGGARPVGAISIPTRYLHTGTETANRDDIAATTDLLTAFLRSETGDHDYAL
ncbi:MAG: M42 family metallopeptidase [Halolamina sp.]